MSSQPPATPTKHRDWADDDDDGGDSSDEEFKALALPVASPNKSKIVRPDQEPCDDKPVASLLSRISGLSTNPTPSSASSSSGLTTEAPASASPSKPPSTTRPKPQTTNALFGRALAGVKSDRAPPPSASSSTPAPSQPPAQPAAAPTAASSSAKSTELIPDKPAGKASGKMVTDLLTGNSDDGWETSGPASDNKDTNGDGPAHTSNVEMDSASNADPASTSVAGGDSASKNGNDGNDGAEDENMSGLISNDFQVQVKLADQQADPNSPLYSVKQFEQLPIHPQLLKGIYQMGFTRPSKIQERALPLLLTNPPRNLIGQSQSGTGKTAAFVLNMLSRVDPGIAQPQAICLAPSRELARQIWDVTCALGRETQVQAMLAVPGSWRRGVRIDKHILIGTPGTMVDMLGRGKQIFDPDLIRVLVLDEADEMVALQGLGAQTTRVKKMLPPHVQTVLFSATFPDEVTEFAQEFAPEANSIFLKKEEVTVEAIKQLYLECDGDEAKFDALSALYGCLTIGQSMVFCRRRDTADMISERLKGEGHSVASLHGEKETNERDDIINGFRDGKTKVLITTNVVARGIDIKQVNMVVNYDVPTFGPEGDFRPDIETYIHRIGRTGRFGRKGVAVTFSSDSRSREDVQYIMDQLKPMKKIRVDRKADIDELEDALKAVMKKD